MLSALCGRNKVLITIVFNILIFIIFGIGYSLYLQNANDHWSSESKNPWLDGFYASAIIHTSVGYGDFFPHHWGGKLMVKIHALTVFLVNLYAGICVLNPGYTLM